jgi:hypothetical protein
MAMNPMVATRSTPRLSVRASKNPGTKVAAIASVATRITTTR